MCAKKVIHAKISYPRWIFDILMFSIGCIIWKESVKRLIIRSFFRTFCCNIVIAVFSNPFHIISCIGILIQAYRLLFIHTVKLPVSLLIFRKRKAYIFIYISHCCSKAVVSS